MVRTIRSSGHEALRRALVEARQAAGLTQAELALRLGAHQSMVARIEGGERRIDVVEMIVLARALEIDPAVLLTETERATAGDHRI